MTEAAAATKRRLECAVATVTRRCPTEKKAGTDMAAARRMHRNKLDDQSDGATAVGGEEERRWWHTMTVEKPKDGGGSKKEYEGCGVTHMGWR